VPRWTSESWVFWGSRWASLSSWSPNMGTVSCC
jgi:hypothetical protein